MKRISVEQILGIIGGLRKDIAVLGWRMMSPKQNDRVIAVLSDLETQYGPEYLTKTDEELLPGIELAVKNYPPNL